MVVSPTYIMEINLNQSRPIGDNEAFVLMIITATEDEDVKETIKTILNLPASQRQIVIHQIVEDMKKDSMPADFIEAIAALTDAELAVKIKEVLKIN